MDTFAPLRATKFAAVACLLCFLSAYECNAQPVIYVNQVAFDQNGPKTAVIRNSELVPGPISFILVEVKTGKTIFHAQSAKAITIDEWDSGKFFYPLDFSTLNQQGRYHIQITVKGRRYKSAEFDIAENALAKMVIPSILHYYRKQRANTPQELAADEKLQLFGSAKTVDMRGGWCDASGDVSKYFSHLAYANFMSPQQTPLVTWSMASVAEAIPKQLAAWGVKDSITDEALWGADYMMRSLADSGYFYMIAFSYFNKDPKARRVVGLLANSVTTADYQCAFREGGGMAIAALARIARWPKHGAFTSTQYFDGARRAFAHLLVNNTRYDDDGKENIIDNYCALLAATELWISTDSALYRDEARKRASSLSERMMPGGYFRANDSDRPFWHASDAGLPVVALARYLAKETDSNLRATAIQTISKALDYNLRVTNNGSNPFGYARQHFQYQGKIKSGFFIPHENETGWWWQGENARLGSLSAAALIGGKLVYPGKTYWGINAPLAVFASHQLSWILGCNPYSTCFLYGFGKKNVPFMQSNYGHGSERGGISNGITGKAGNGDGSGIDFKTEAAGDEWRWTEQWIPHAAWFLQAVAATVQ